MRNKENGSKGVIEELYDKLYIPLFILLAVMLLTIIGFGMMYIQEKRTASAETIDHTVPATEVSIKNIKWDGKTRVIDCDFEPIEGAKKYYAEVCPDKNFFFGCIKAEIGTNSPLQVHIEQNKINAETPTYMRVRAQLSGKKYTEWSKNVRIKADKKTIKKSEKRDFWTKRYTRTVWLVALSIVCFLLYDKCFCKNKSQNDNPKDC